MCGARYQLLSDCYHGFCTGRRGFIRRVALALGVIPLAIVALPQASSSAALALASSYYPQRATIAAIPATNAEADHLLGPAHRSSFERLHRLDALGWLQAAQWHFKTGRGGATWHHLTIFGYGINVFGNRQQAQRALRDVKLKTGLSHVAHLAARRFRSSDAHETLVFTFFVYRAIEIEAYYEYIGPAPAHVARQLRKLYNRQSSRLARLAHLLTGSLHAAPTPTTTVTATVTATPTETPTVTPAPAVLARPTATPSATSTPAPTPTPTPTPAGFVVKVGPSSPAYRPGDEATVTVQVTLNSQPVQGARVTLQFDYPSHAVTCTAVTGPDGAASCGETVPGTPDGMLILVEVHVLGPNGESASTTTTFQVQNH